MLTDLIGTLLPAEAEECDNESYQDAELDEELRLECDGLL